MRLEQGASEFDPVVELQLEGELEGFVACSFMVELPPRSKRRRVLGKRFVRCGMEASLIRFAPEWGMRSFCEDGHVVILSPLLIPGLRDLQRLKSETD